MVPASAGYGAEDGVWAPHRRSLTVGLLLTITLVALEALAIATVMPTVRADLGGFALYGWVFSGFFLASLLGIVVAGHLADQKGAIVPFTVGLALFAIGLVVGGLAESMVTLVAGRLLQGLGAGAISSTGYTVIARAYPAAVRPRMFAMLSTAWVVPGLVGPAIAAGVEHAWSWHWVFLGLLPFVLVAGLLTVPSLARLGSVGVTVAVDPLTRAAGRRRLGRVGVLVVGVGAVLAAATEAPMGLAVALVVVGLPAACWAFVGLVPPGTVRLVPGVPATVAVRGILTGAFFSADAYLPLAVVEGRGAGTWLAGTALSASAVLWALGSWYQVREVDRQGPRRLVTVGFMAIMVGVGLLLAVAFGLPVWLAVPAWGIAGFGMGTAYSPLSITVLAAARAGEEGQASAALQLSDTLGVAVGTGIGGAFVALAAAQSWAVITGVTLVFATALLVAVAGLFATRRLPERVPDQHAVPSVST